MITKVTKEICKAFYFGERKTIGNSSVLVDDVVRATTTRGFDSVITLTLFGNPIAQLLDGEL